MYKLLHLAATEVPAVVRYGATDRPDGRVSAACGRSGTWLAPRGFCFGGVMQRIPHLFHHDDDTDPPVADAHLRESATAVLAGHCVPRIKFDGRAIKRGSDGTFYESHAIEPVDEGGVALTQPVDVATMGGPDREVVARYDPPDDWHAATTEPYDDGVWRGWLELDGGGECEVSLCWKGIPYAFDDAPPLTFEGVTNDTAIPHSPIAKSVDGQVGYRAGGTTWPDICDAGQPEGRVPTTPDKLRDYLDCHGYHGIVWWSPDGRRPVAQIERACVGLEPTESMEVT